MIQLDSYSALASGAIVFLSVYAISKDDNEKDALIQSILFRRWDSTRELLARSDALRRVRFVDGDGYGPLHYACIHDAPLDIVKFICSVDPHQATRKTNYNDTPLHHACFSASEEVIEQLLNVAPQAAAMSGSYHRLPLLEAVFRRRSPSIIKRILVAHPAAVYAADKFEDGLFKTFFDVWQKYRQTSRANRERSGQGDDVDEGITLLNDTYTVLLKAYLGGAVDETLPLHYEFLPIHETLKLHNKNVPSELITALDRSMHLECSQHDEEGNFALHVACSFLLSM